MTAATILVIEDNPLTRKMVRVALQSEGYLVQEAGDGTTALAILESCRPDLILQDLHLPDTDGIALVRRLRAHPGAATVPILAFSGLLSKIEEARAVRGGFTDYLFKPIEVSRLLDVVQSHLQFGAIAAVPEGQRRDILLVDDNPARREQTRVHLETMGFDVRAAPNADAALLLARAVRPAALVTELLLLDGSGLELCLALRRDPELATIPCIVCASAFGQLEDSDHRLAHALGASVMVPRSPGLPDLLQAIHASLREEHPPMPVVDADQLHADYLRQLLRQLEHQTQLNADLLRRSATDTALLSIMSGAADVLMRTADLDEVLDDVLIRALDAGGVSAGAIFLLEGKVPRLRAHAGFGDPDTGIATFFGHADLLARLIESGTPIQFASDRAAEPAIGEVLRRARTQALLVAPLLVGGIPQGGLVLQGSARELGPGFMASIGTMANQLGLAVALSRSVDRLRSSELRFRTLFERMPVGLFRCGPDGRYLDANDEFARLLGYREATEILGQNVQSLFSTPEAYVAWLASLVAAGEQRNTDVRIVRPDRTEAYAMLSARATDTPGEWEGILSDITARRRIRRRLKAQYEVSRVLAEATSLDQGSALVLATLAEEFAASFGVLWKPDPEGHQLVCALTWPGADAAPPHFAAVTSTMRFLPGEGVVGEVWRTGEPLTIPDIGAAEQFRRKAAATADTLRGGLWIPIRGEHGVTAVLEMIFARRITIDAELDDALRTIAGQIGQWGERIRAIEELRTAQERLSHVLATARAVLYVLRFEQGQAIPEWVSENIERMTGYSAAEAMGSTWWSDRIHPDDRERVLAQDASPDGDEASRAYRFLHRNGEYFWLRDIQQIVHDSEGRPTGLVGAWMDVTEMKTLEAQLVQAQKMEGIGRVAAGVAHDFNNVLTAIIGNTEMLRMEYAPGDAHLESLEEIMKATQHATGLTRQLLAFSRRQQMHPVLSDLNQIVTGVSRMLARVIGEDVGMSLDLAPGVPEIRVDVGQIEQILVNLAVNARDAMPLGGSIVLTTWSTGGEVCFAMQDSGTGIPPEVLPKIFEPFFTTKGDGKGTGLGLSTVYGIVKQSGGTIEVRSEPGGGTTFTVSFPVATELSRED